MRFKTFIDLLDEDNGLMGFPKASSLKKPSDGQPFKNLGSVAGQEPRGNTGGAGGVGAKPMFMRKMKKS